MDYEITIEGEVVERPTSKKLAQEALRYWKRRYPTAAQEGKIRMTEALPEKERTL